MNRSVASFPMVANGNAVKSNFENKLLQNLPPDTITQATQSAGCNAKHSVEQRLARWLLLCCTRTKSTSIPISQEFLSDMLGVRRTSVTLAVGQLKDRRLIEHHRGVILIPDEKALEKRACECYRVVKDHLENYTEYESGFAV